MSIPVAWDVLVGDCRAILASLPAESAHTCITSPPYFGLRDYGHGGQIGLESTPDEFVVALVDAFRAVRRVLRDDGTVWLNLGDSYAGGGCGARDPERWPKQSRNDHMPTHAKAATGLKAKDLIGIPWMVAFALRADGWYLRSDIIWAKPNPTPESVTDRPTKAHEYVFLLSKHARYYYDTDAIREEGKDWTTSGPGVGIADTSERYGAGNGGNDGLAKLAQRYRDARMSDDGRELLATGARHSYAHPRGRNKRSVWTVATQPYSDAHFATFPPALIEPCVVAGCPEGGTVLDPFAGAGTTGIVACRNRRSFVGIELNADYAQMARDRIATDIRLGHRLPVRVASGGPSLFDLEDAL